MDVMYHLLISSDQQQLFGKNEKRNKRLVKERGTGVVICAGQDPPSGHKINLKGHMMVNSMKNKYIYLRKTIQGGKNTLWLKYSQLEDTCNV